LYLRKGIRLRTVAALLVTGIVLLTATISSYLSFKSNREMLNHSYLESNYRYAANVASNTTELLQAIQGNLSTIAEKAGKTSFTTEDLDIWFSANKNYFNSIFIADENRVIQMISSNVKGIEIGDQLNSDGAVAASGKKKFLISNPYVSVTGRFIILMSAPIITPGGSYKGFVGGTLYLEEQNSLSNVLKQHSSDDGSYVYVADQKGHLIFHPDQSRTREIITNNEVINQALAGKSGKQQIVNSKGESYFAGYSYEPMSSWAIVSQTPTANVEQPMRKLLQKMIMQILPVLVILLLLAWRMSLYLSRPLYHLAKFSEEMSEKPNAFSNKLSTMPSSIYEVKQLNHSMSKYLELMNKELSYDGLTGLTNRKTFNSKLEQYMMDGIPFSLILIDIDHFKRVNDTYGHQVGDEVLKYLAVQMRAHAADGDICFRYGGEEFGMLIQGENVKAAEALAERLRIHLMNTNCATGQPIHVSIGITHSDIGAGVAHELVEQADKALYQSKARGRNRVTVWQKDEN